MPVQVGRAYFEMVDCPEAARCFQWARQLDPYRLKVGWYAQKADVKECCCTPFNDRDRVTAWGGALAARTR